MIVSDFDEFLVCPTEPNVESQHNHLKNYIENSLENKVDQISFRQQSALNKTEDPLECMINATALSMSPLGCMASRRFTSGGHSIKSLHLNYVCPLTGFHEVMVQFVILICLPTITKVENEY